MNANFKLLVIPSHLEVTFAAEPELVDDDHCEQDGRVDVEESIVREHERHLITWDGQGFCVSC